MQRGANRMAMGDVTRPGSGDLGFVRNTILAMAVVLVAGFIVQLAAGRSSFESPLIVHIHAVAFMGWVGLTVTQTWLAASGALAGHRLLGRVAMAWSLALLVLGPLVTIFAVQAGRVPFFFQPQHFLIADPATVLAFFGLFAAAIILRRDTGWHARLQIAAFMPLLGPGFGRLLPLPLLAPWAFEIAALGALIVPAIGIARDLKVRGRVHPAWWWAIGVLGATLIIARLLAFSPVGDALYAAAIAGHPTALTDGRAFPPAPGPPPGM
jgi:hypothetical protein